MTLDVRHLGLPGVRVITPRRFGDARGYFTETYKRSVWAEAGIGDIFVQDNLSFSAEPFTLRGLHLQTAPFAQAKLVRVVRGRIFDVAVDVRRGSPTFGRWSGEELSEGEQIYIPVGYAHGILTLEPKTEVAYKVSAEYSPLHEKTLAWNDPEVAIDWPLGGAAPVLSDKDRAAPTLAALATLLESAG